MAIPEETWARYLEADTKKTPAGQGPAMAPLVQGLTILHHPDARRIGERVALPALASGRQVHLSRVEPLFTAPGESLRRPLADPFLSRSAICLAPESGLRIRLLRAGSATTVVINGEPVVGERVISQAELELGAVLVLAERLVLLLHRMNPSLPRGPRFGMVGESLALGNLRREIQQVASLSGPLLLRGETGSGKELVARAVHQASPRSQGPYQAVNMGAIPSSLAAAELFGAEKGAFTGADKRRQGLFARNHGGTLFLDEIGETPPEIQVALLRALEEGEVQPIGAEQPQKVDVRIIAATDANLEKMIQEGTFRAPLWHRLSGCEILLPPLRQRRDDIGRLLLFFLEQELESVGAGHLLATAPDQAPWLSAHLVARLASYHWPGNVRQLRNVARRLVVTCRADSTAHITPEIERLLPAAAAQERSAPSRPRKKYRDPVEVREEELLAALHAHRFRLQPTAAALGISRTALYGLIDRFPSIRKPGDLSRQDLEQCQERCAGDLEAMVDELKVSRHGLRRRMTELGMA